MEIYPCSKQPEVKKPKTLTYDEIMNQEGIYRSAIDSDLNWRIVVFGGWYAGKNQSIFVSDSRARIGVCEGVKKCTFIKTDEQLCLEIR